MKKLIVFLLIVGCGDLGATPVNINSADAKTIAASLSGIGEKKADAIVKYRQEQGAFKSVEDWVKVTGMGEKLLEKIKVDVWLTEEATGAAETAVAPAPVSQQK